MAERPGHPFEVIKIGGIVFDGIIIVVIAWCGMEAGHQPPPGGSKALRKVGCGAIIVRVISEGEDRASGLQQHIGGDHGAGGIVWWGAVALGDISNYINDSPIHG